MSPRGRGPVVIDTGVFSARLARIEKPLASGYQSLVEGRARILSFVTVAELRYGAKRAGWGEKRLQRLDYEITRCQIVWPGPELVEVYANLRTWCVNSGHGLGHKEHEADRWIAATAIHLGIPLVAHDAIFFGIKDLRLITRLEQPDG